MTATPIPQLKREALAGLASLDATLANMPPIAVASHPRRFWRYVPADSSWTIGRMVEVPADVAACAAVEGREL